MLYVGIFLGMLTVILFIGLMVLVRMFFKDARNSYRTWKASHVPVILDWKVL